MDYREGLGPGPCRSESDTTDTTSGLLAMASNLIAMPLFDALVTSNFLLLVVMHLLLVAMP